MTRRHGFFCILVSVLFSAILSQPVAAQGGFSPSVAFGDFYQAGTDQMAVIMGKTWFIPDPVTLLVTLDGPTLQMPESGYPLLGDWNGDGKDTPGAFTLSGVFRLRTQFSGDADITFAFGQGGDVPVVGDWDGNGVDTVGVYRAGTWYLTNTHSNSGAPIQFGNSFDYPVAGDWDNDGDSTIGVYAGGLFTLSDDLFGFNLSFVPLSHPSGGLPVTFRDHNGDGVALVVDGLPYDTGFPSGKIIIRPGPDDDGGNPPMF